MLKVVNLGEQVDLVADVAYNQVATTWAAVSRNGQPHGADPKLRCEQRQEAMARTKIC